SAVARQFGHRTTLAVPLLRADEAIGAIAVRRTEARPFSDRQVELLQTFADQAVIAIENTRLFRELETHDAASTATGELRHSLPRSPPDGEPVFEAIVRSASRLCGGEYAIVTRYDGERLHLAAQHNPRAGAADETARLFPQVPRPDSSL